jgi:hypothetical protein
MPHRPDDGSTTTEPTILGWIVPKYGYCPSLSNVKLNVSPLLRTFESKLLSFDDVDVAVCRDESLFIQVTLSPTLIPIGSGLYELPPKFPTMLTTFHSSVTGNDEISSCGACTDSSPAPNH